MPTRHLAAAAAALALVSAACADASDDPGSGPVTVEVPTGWRVDDDATTGAEQVLEERRWRREDGGAGVLQVIVACGEGDADQLRVALGRAYRAVAEPPAIDVEVAGLDSAQRVTLALSSDPMGDTTGAFRLDGLYGAGSGGLVVVELGGPSEDHDPDLVDQVLGSVEVDGQALATRCAETGS